MQPPHVLVASLVLLNARARTGLSQTEFARRAGITQSTLSAYECGRRQPTLPMLLRLLHSVGLDLRIELTEQRGRAEWERAPDESEDEWLRRIGFPGYGNPD